MNLNKQSNEKLMQIRLLHDDETLVQSISSEVTSWLPVRPCDYVAVFIGTDRSTGDSLGPLAGTLFSERRPRNMTVYGTLHRPVHATNLEAYVQHIKEEHRNPFIIAVDACLGRSTSIGYITAHKGPLRPGAALNKNLPEIGDVHLTGIVNTSGFMEHAVLQNTRLSIVMDMAKGIADIMEKVDDSLARPRRFSAAVVQRFISGKSSVLKQSGLPPV